jgi:hypothetical protein
MNDTPTDEPAAIEAPLEVSEISRPAHVPEKFWDDEAGAVRIDALVKSYLELERKLGSGRREPEPDPEALPPLEVETMPEPSPPTEPEAWAIASPHPLIEPDGELNELLRSAGFSQTQAQLVYDLAAQRLLPVIQDALGEIEAQQQLERLQRHFGGAETWSHTARQLKSWAASHLDPAIHETLAGSYEGVLALHQMMRASEPELLAGAAGSAPELSEAALVELMRDPRYWRQRDPEFIARVTAGFKRLYAD